MEFHNICIYKCRRCGKTFIKFKPEDGTQVSPRFDNLITYHYECKLHTVAIGIGDLIGYDLRSIDIIEPIQVNME